MDYRMCIFTGCSVNAVASHLLLAHERNLICQRMGVTIVGQLVEHFMSDIHRNDVWADGELYEPFVGRWSRFVAPEFLNWLAVKPGGRWLDVGCGTGALTQTILVKAAPQWVIGVDRSEGFVNYARSKLSDTRATFDVADAQTLDKLATATFDAVVSGLVLNFVPKPDLAVREISRVAKSGAVVAVYVWDYADKM